MRPPSRRVKRTPGSSATARSSANPTSACPPGAIHPHTIADAELYVLSAKEGGRHTAFATGYRPQFFFGPTDVTGTIDADAPILPGSRARVRFTLDRAIALDEGVRFALREGKRTIGAGLIVAVR